MTREEAKVLLPIIQAYAEGKTIQVVDTTDQCGTWEDVVDLKINTDFEEYRIKPESTYRPFKDKEECWQEMLKHQPFGWVKRNGYYYNIIAIGVISVTIIGSEGNIARVNYSDLLSRYSFVDGTPFGVKVEE